MSQVDQIVSELEGWKRKNSCGADVQLRKWHEEDVWVDQLGDGCHEKERNAQVYSHGRSFQRWMDDPGNNTSNQSGGNGREGDLHDALSVLEADVPISHPLLRIGHRLGDVTAHVDSTPQPAGCGFVELPGWGSNACSALFLGPNAQKLSRRVIPWSPHRACPRPCLS